MEIISRSDREYVEQYSLCIGEFDQNEGYFIGGCSFPCDAEGNIDWTLEPYDIGNRWFQNNPSWGNVNRMIDGYCRGQYEMEIEDRSSWQRIPMRIRCEEAVTITHQTLRNGVVVDESREYETCNNEIDLWDDTKCGNCGQWYNSFGQRLRDNWMSNPSNWDSDIGDMEGYEMSMAGDY